MDGYSVTEAASVLGVPEARVWELLARGVISGIPEGAGMRVFLRTQPAPIAPSTAEPGRGERPRTNGNGGRNGGAHDGGEASAFRELLTEFRNLTERYGQALLALGESRGEVAGLRSRVELLEARVDLRLTASAPASSVAWAPAEEAPKPIPRSLKPAAAGPAPAPRRRPSVPRPAVSNFAEALARADDPTVSELTAGREAAEALAAMQAEIDTAPEVAAVVEEEAELTLAAAPAPEADVELEAETESPAQAAAEVGPPVIEKRIAPEPSTAAETPITIEPEPDWFADGDFAWLDAVDMDRPETTAAATAVKEVRAQSEAPVEPMPVEMAIPSAEPETPVRVEAGHDHEPGWGASPAAAAEVAGAQIQDAFDESPAPPEPMQAFAAPIEPEVEVAVIDAVPSAMAADLPPAWKPIATEEPAIEVETGHRPSLGSPEPTETSSLAHEAAMAELESASSWRPGEGDPSSMAAPPPSGLQLSDTELAQLAADEGWDTSEVEAIRALIGRGGAQPGERGELPGAGELKDAMAALEAVPVEPRQASADAVAEDQEWWRQPSKPMTPPPQPAPIRPGRQLLPRPPDSGTAANAYRRLRRLLGG